MEHVSKKETTTFRIMLTDVRNIAVKCKFFSDKKIYYMAIYMAKQCKYNVNQYFIRVGNLWFCSKQKKNRMEIQLNVINAYIFSTLYMRKLFAYSIHLSNTYWKLAHVITKICSKFILLFVINVCFVFFKKTPLKRKHLGKQFEWNFLILLGGDDWFREIKCRI